MASGNDMKAAQSTYDSFIGVVKVATPVIALIAATVIYLLAH
ncbi:MAG: aa3-type cytochrome c oxidase subunit IV [Pseudomonadota bacterium]|nr:aa3-type cytochrome c oxidase subunit IV [Pseudomonadota bacterium]